VNIGRMATPHHANGTAQPAQVEGGGDAGSERDRKAAISMLPNADLSVHTCDSCSKDITGVRQQILGVGTMRNGEWQGAFGN